MKKYFKILTLSIFFVSGFLFSSQSVFAYIPDSYNPDPSTYSYCTQDVQLACDNSNSISGINSCGTGCLSLCDDPSFNQGNKDSCISKLNTTSSWSKYNAVSYTCTLIECGNYRNSCVSTEFNYYFSSAVCSTADKESSSDSQLNFGYCSCASGNTYKSCCRTNSDGTMSSVAVRKYDADNQSPLEGECSLENTIYTSSSCPQPPEINLINSDVSSTKTFFSPGDKVNLQWTVSNQFGNNEYSLQGDSELASVSNTSCASNQIKNIQKISANEWTGVFPVPQDTQTPSDIPVSVSCSNYYGVPTPGYKAEKSISASSKPVTIRVDKVAATKPPPTCSDIDPKYYCSATQKQDDPYSGSTIQVQRTVIPAISCKEPNNKCYVNKCARCSDLPENKSKGIWVEWYDRNNDNCSSDWDNQRTTTEDDPRCGPPLCNISLSAYPSSLDAANPSSILTATSSNDSVKNCTIDNGVGQVTPGSDQKPSVSPKNTTTYTVSCSSKKKESDKCSASATVEVASKCSVSISPATQTINKGGSVSLTLKTTNVQSCIVEPGSLSVNINQQAEANTPLSPVSPSQTTTYSATCSAKNDPKSTCSSATPPPGRAGAPQTGNSTITVNQPNQNIPVSGSINVSGVLSPYISASPQCLPQGNTNFNTTLSWGARTNDQCLSLIGGGSGSVGYSCAVNNQNQSNPFSENLRSFDGIGGKTYNIQCTSNSYTCSSSKSFTSGDSSQNYTACEAERQRLNATYGSNISSNYCSGYCIQDNPHTDQYCTSWTLKTNNGTCQNIKSYGHCTRTGGLCTSNSDCGHAGVAETCGGMSSIGACSNTGNTCSNNSGCSYSFWDTPCRSWSCSNYGYTLYTSSKTINPTSASSSTQVRVLSQPSINYFSSQDNSGASKSKILLNQAVNMVWRAASNAVSLFFPSGTTLLCKRSSTPSSNWNSDYLPGASGSMVLSPKITTIYNLLCRDRDNADNQCYRESGTSTQQVEVYTSTLQETGN